jgi:hypothetical protein
VSALDEAALVALVDLHVVRRRKVETRGEDEVAAKLLQSRTHKRTQGRGPAYLRISILPRW